MASSVAGQWGEYPAVFMGDVPLKRTSRGKGASQNRYYKNMYKGVRSREQSQDYNPPRLKDLRKQNRLGTKKFYAKRRVPRSVPRAPFNDSTYLMHMRRSGGLASLEPTVPSPVFSSPASSSYKLGNYEQIVDGNDYGYGSMTGLIHLRPTDDGDRSSGSTVDNDFSNDMYVEQPSVSSADSAQELEQRLEKDISRFEMAPIPETTSEGFLEQRVARQDIHIAHLEDENLVLKERLFLIQQEIDELNQRLLSGQRCDVGESDDNEEIHDAQSCLGT
ncbi:uncharacterized protein [Physcomitrium patens]|uniref:PRLI-interacting factor A n=1 Tax=Physcomitrium patens TaxID=3218 RepID=A0A2K1JH96_PHYPA|nr:uncharacterized protein LOC112291460 [Physcomitrium patens]XP_024394639.1 uncharacterized protein LOC112291460 [Physcomitrium patens]XP_024394640.1 uncharacterized protein LOC112291460 [Physcomitrium patens]XP_024394642.1 uncharacterized protein LOC112291460 [Physcomitrium patens]XP_024394643.1 uncharacterized protein LOC112291460 [Physcomitrium patens]XP_024394644.1 uncharacterized protein LOC112291460 [Physcomitrium patens]XP_024394645.1 uncharacterized protein LOC112291460 [Physcomitriu|eukprot:XP_024394638.1 uncharacterized protein LOC112291460 [Physcomitrella patens]